MMSLHKLTAGDGYTYLTRQVAAADATERGPSSLADYYSSKGESPGQWIGSGLSALDSMTRGDHVSEAQMKALFGEGRHPDADAIEARISAAAIARGLEPAAAAEQALAATRLGQPYRIYEGASEFRTAVAKEFSEYNVARGEAWNTVIDPETRSEIRTKVANQMFEAEFGRPALDDREVSGFVAKNSRPKTSAVAGYDLTFSPVKSVSTLAAVAPRELAEAIIACHDAAVADVIAHLEKTAIYTRSGTNGVQQLDTEGLIAAAFKHRDSRAGDPDFHTHVAISNKVKVRGEERWLALDGRPLHKAAVAASEMYNSRLEGHLRERLGLRFAEREGTDPSKRPVREIVGVDPALMKVWSSRRAAIESRRGELAAQFQADHGREPSSIEALELAQQATLETRDAKHEPRSLAEQRAVWRATALEVLGSEHALSEMIRVATHPPRSSSRIRTNQQWIDQSAEAVLETISASRARWQECHVRAEAERIARSANLSRRKMDKVVDRIVAAALGPERSVSLGVDEGLSDPAELCRADGSSVYSTAGTTMYTSEAIMAAEERLVAASQLMDGRSVDSSTVDIALLEQAANDFELNAGQAKLVRELATSGARLQLALAPAGTGKTTAMAVLARSWEAEGGRVIGLAPTAAAAAALRKDLDATTDTMNKLTHVLEELAAAATNPDQAVDVPEWIQNIDDSTLVVIDEAGMAGTADLDAVVSHILAKGGSVRLVGDDQQLASVSSGGALRDIAQTSGAVTLTDVVRFADAAEGYASLALRDGDPAAIGFYIDHGRVHVGDTVAAEDLAYAGWSADRAAGLDAVMLAPTRDMVRNLNERARADRLALDGRSTGPEVALSDGSSASSGDIITTRKNNRRLRTSATDFVRNGDRWTVTDVRSDGSLHVTHLASGRKITLPAGYVRKNVQLGYARTIHGAQGITADSCHTVGTGGESRQLAYVALTRGKLDNHLYLATAGDGDEHSVVTPDGITPPTAVDLFSRILGRDGAQESATSAQRRLEDPHLRLAHAAAAYDDAVGTAAEHLLGKRALRRIDKAAEKLVAGLSSEPAYPVLRKHLAILAANGADPVQTLESAARSRELDTAHDVAAVLDWRLDPSGAHSGGSGPLSWLPAVPASLSTHKKWGTYLNARADLVSELAADVRTRAADYSPDGTPLWARGLLDTDRELLSDLAVWRAAHGVEDIDLRPTGPDQFAVADRRAQTVLRTRAATVLGDPAAAAKVWESLATKVEPRLVSDPYWPVLAEQLSAAQTAGVDVPSLVRLVSGDKPLPDEMPAAALWWRLSRHLETTETSKDAIGGLEPVWTPHLRELFGENAQRVIDDAAWPQLVAAINAADPEQWNAADLLTVAHDLLAEAHADAPMPADHLAAALARRVEAIVEASTAYSADDLPPEPLDLDAEEAAAAAAGSYETYFDDAAALAEFDAHAPTYEDAGERTEPEFDDAATTFGDDFGYYPGEETAADLEYAPEDFGEVETWTGDPVVATRYSDLEPAEQLARLRDDLDAAREHKDALWAAMLDGTSEHLVAVLPMIAEIHSRADTQRPYASEAAYAHQRWVDASIRAEIGGNEVARLGTESSAARAEGNDDLAADLDSQLALEQIIASAATTEADRARAEYELAQQALEDAAGGVTRIVTSTDAEQVRLMAGELDNLALNEARATYRALENQVWRAEMRAAKALADDAVDALYSQPLPPTREATSPSTDSAQTSMAPTATAVLERPSMTDTIERYELATGRQADAFARSVLHTAVPEDLARALENSDDWNRVAAILSRVENTGIDAHTAAASAATATARRFPQTVIDYARSTPTTPRRDTADLLALPLPLPATPESDADLDRSILDLHEQIEQQAHAFGETALGEHPAWLDAVSDTSTPQARTVVDAIATWRHLNDVPDTEAEPLAGAQDDDRAAARIRAALTALNTPDIAAEMNADPARQLTNAELTARIKKSQVRQSTTSSELAAAKAQLLRAEEQPATTRAHEHLRTVDRDLTAVDQAAHAETVRTAAHAELAQAHTELARLQRTLDETSKLSPTRRRIAQELAEHAPTVDAARAAARAADAAWSTATSQAPPRNQWNKLRETAANQQAILDAAEREDNAARTAAQARVATAQQQVETTEQTVDTLTTEQRRRRTLDPATQSAEQQWRITNPPTRTAPPKNTRGVDAPETARDHGQEGPQL